MNKSILLLFVEHISRREKSVGLKIINSENLMSNWNIFLFGRVKWLIFITGTKIVSRFS